MSIEDLLEIAYKDYNVKTVCLDRNSQNEPVRVTFVSDEKEILKKDMEPELVEKIFDELHIAKRVSVFHEQAFTKVLSRNPKQRLNGMAMTFLRRDGKASVSLMMNSLEKYEEIWPTEVPYDVLKMYQKHYGNGYTTGSFMQQIEAWRKQNVKYEWR